MTNALKLTKFAKDNGVSNRQIVMCGVHPQLDAQRFAFIAFQKHTSQVHFFFNQRHAPFQEIVKCLR